MKKNVMMRVASVMLVLVLLTSSVISGTFAKYVTTGDAGDSARVAKWGVVITGDSNIFAETYETDDDSFTLETNTVISSGTYADVNDLVAPGTTKENVTVIAISGKPEVATRVAYVGDVTLSNWEDADGNFYCPIVITITDYNGNEKAKIDGFTYSSATELESAIETYINNFSQDYKANTNLASEDNGGLKLSWSWPYYVSDDRDVKDTYLGNCAAGLIAGKTAAVIDITIDVTATQID